MSREVRGWNDAVDGASDEIAEHMRMQPPFATDEERDDYIEELCATHAKGVLHTFYDDLVPP